jgi:amino acid adenylation domain-containing protein
MEESIKKECPDAMVSNAQKQSSPFPLLIAAEREGVPRRFNATAVAYPKSLMVHELFEEQVKRSPNAIALMHEQKSLTYAELNAKGNQLARYLLNNHALRPDQLVGICVGRNAEMVVGLLGVLKAGGAYVPLDPNYPSERLRYMLEDADPKIVLTQDELRAALPTTQADVITLDLELQEISSRVAENLKPAELGLSAQNLVYVIYTSGSSGQPKGTAMSHRSMVNLIEWHRRTFRSRQVQRVLQFAALSFDVAFQETFSTLCTGGTLVLLDEWVRRDTRALAELLSRQSVQRFFVPPLVLHSLAAYCHNVGAVPESVQDVITAGEQLRITPEITYFFQQLRGCRLHNHYGPTETHVVTALTLSGDCEQWPILPAIGRPISNTQIYVLDGQLQPVSIGHVGEIYIGGMGVARGYLKRPELTAQRFISDLYSADSRVRLYKTGDLGRWRIDGTLEYLGRNDDQVKIRGFRIELGEIETQLAGHKQVRDAVVVAHEDVAGDKRLVAYITLRGPHGPTVEELRTHLQAILPEYMVPNAYVTLKSFPLTPNGKLDRRALPAPDIAAYTNRPYEPPRGEVEGILAGIWQDLLGLERVGRQDDFFELGGHSLLIVQMVERLRRTGLSMGGHRAFESPILSELASTVTREAAGLAAPPNLIPSGCGTITPEMLSLVELQTEHINQIVKTVPGGACNIQDIYPLAPLQEGILFHHLLSEQGGDAYVLSMLLSLSSQEKLEEFIRALQNVIDRHDILRTAILWGQLPQPLQVVYRHAVLPVEVLALNEQRDPIEQLKDRMKPERQRLDLRQAPLLRLQVAADAQGAQRYALLQLHHMVGDHESVEITIAEVKTHLEGRAGELPDPVPYRNHVAQAMAHDRTHDDERFFRGKLQEIEEPTAPFGLMDVHGDGSQIAQTYQRMDVELGGRIRIQARRLGVSAATLFHVGWALVLARTSGRDDVVFGTSLLGRLQGNSGGQQTIGMFINTLPLRLRLDGVSASELVEQAQIELAALLGHEQASLAVAQRCSGIIGSAPLFSALLNYRHRTTNLESGQRLTSGIKMLSSFGWTNYPVVLSVDDLGEGFTLTTQTDRRIDPQRMMGYVSTGMRSLVEALEQAPRTPALALSLLPESERRQVLEQFNATRKPYPHGKLVHELFEDQVKRTPEAEAVNYEGQNLSYAELNGRANQVARYLRARGVEPDQPVGICVERSLEMVVGLLGILKAGGAYVPLDPDYPPERLQYMLEDAAPKVLLIQERLRPRVPQTAARVIALDEQWSQIGRQDGDDLSAPELGLTERHLAYVIYTSGSTGKPKGAMNEHRGVINRLQWMQDAYGLNSHDRVLQKTPFSFDVSVWEFFWTLTSGASLVMARPEGHKDPGYLRELIEQTGVTTLHFVPSMLQSFLDQFRLGACSSLRHVVCSGEELPSSLQKKFFELLPRVSLSNLYGPTEAAVDVTAWECNPGDHSARVPIGRPISNIQMYVLDRHMQPAPMGVSGELYIGGVGVGRGYLKRAELTAERFLKDPFSADPELRLYKTGDLGRWRTDGAIEYLGRNDYQVKIRGFRIELGEIEAQLSRHEQVKEAAVLAREDQPGEKRLVGYVVARDAANAPVSAELLRAYLKGMLPEHMVPSAFVVMERFPLTPNGKLDRKALPVPEQGAYVRRQYEAPQGEVEEILAGIWQGLLPVERVGRQDNFFELGGHSLLIVQMLERLRRVGLSVEVRAVFESPTLADLVGVLTRESMEQIEVPPNGIPLGCDAITPQMLPLVQLDAHQIRQIEEAVSGGVRNIQDIYPLAPLQEGILFHHLLDRERGDTYIVTTLLSVATRGRLEELIPALQKVIDRHDVLRTAVLWEQLPRPVQVVYRQARLPVEVLELEGADTIEKLRERMRPEHQRMDLRQAPLMRLQIAATRGSSSWYALLQMHHMTCDHQTVAAIIAEVVGHLEGRGQLPESVPYRNHVAQSLSYAQKHNAEEFFRSKLEDVEEPTAPFGLLDVHGDGTQIDEAHEEIDPELAHRVRVQARRHGVSAATLLHAAWALVVAHTSSRDDVVFGTVLLGRLQGSAGGQRTLGMFINTLPLRLRLQGLTAKELVERTQRELIELLGHEQASLAVAQRCSGVAGLIPLFTAMLNYRHSGTAHEDSWSDAREIQVLAEQERTNYPIVITVDDLGERLTLTAQTDRQIDPRRMTAYLHAGVHSLVQALEGSPGTMALSLSILPDSERYQLIKLFNATEAVYPKEKLIHQLFEEQVKRTPDAVAVVYESESLTYAQLNARANQLAHYLRDQAVEADQLVGICVERGLELAVGVLGVLKAGGAYVPLDPTYPAERLQYMLDDAAPRVLLVQERLRGTLPASAAEVIALDGDWEHIAQRPSDNLDAKALGLHAQQLAYVIYTSGSTGKPKGVMVEHGNVTRLFAATQAWFYFNERDVWTLFHSFAFDFSVWELWGALFYGGRVVVVPHQTARSPREFYRLLCNEGVTVLNQTPSAFAQLIDAHDQSESRQHCLRVVIFGGEALELRTLKGWVDRNGAQRPQLVNMYGITESTVHVTYQCLSEQDIRSERASLIGKAIPDLQTYLLDRRGEPVPIGVVGEIYVGGAGVARGYLNQTELTAERFVKDPFSTNPQARLYKTGDLGRWRADGTIEYLGRNDQQVKIRGFRIELGEIEAQLARHSQVKEAVVLAREDVPGEKRLVAYVVRRQEPSEIEATPAVEGLRNHLQRLLPEYMVPSAFVVLENLPLTPNGKLDRRALPAPEFGAYASRKYEAPQGEVEEILARIWQALLRVERIGRRDNFFEMGGHSLLAMQVIARIRSEFSVEMPISMLFEFPTLKQLASQTDDLRQARLLDRLAHGGTEIEELLERVASMPDGKVHELLRELEMRGTTL